MPVSLDLINRIFEWTKCYKNNCKSKLKALIAEWPQGESPSQLVKEGDKLGHIAARLKQYNNNYELLVHVHNADSIGRELDPEKKWGKLFNMGGIPGVGIGSAFTRGVISALGGRKTRRRKNKNNKNKKSRRRH